MSLKYFTIGRSFFSSLAAAFSLQNAVKMIGPMPTGHSYRGRRGPASAPGKGRCVTANDTGWWRRHALIRPMPVTERMLMRHGWYRRKLRKQGIDMRAAHDAKNAMVLK